MVVGLSSGTRSQTSEGMPNTIFYEAVYDEDPRGPIRLEQRKISDEVMAGSIDHLSSDEVTLMAVHDIYAVKQDSVTKDEILRWRAEVGAEIAGRTLDNALGRLLKANQLIKVAIWFCGSRLTRTARRTTI